MKQRYVIQQYKNAEDFQNGANALALDGYVIHSFSEHCGAIAAVFELEQRPNSRVNNILTENQRSLV